MLQIIKKDYSNKPWRLVLNSGTPNEIEVSYPDSFDHPDLGTTIVNKTVCGNTKQEALDNTLHLLEMLILGKIKIKAQN